MALSRKAATKGTKTHHLLNVKGTTASNQERHYGGRSDAHRSTTVESNTEHASNRNLIETKSTRTLISFKWGRATQIQDRIQSLVQQPTPSRSYSRISSKIDVGLRI